HIRLADSVGAPRIRRTGNIPGNSSRNPHNTRSPRMRLTALLASLLLLPGIGSAQTTETLPPVIEADAVLGDVAFNDGNTMDQVRIHYRTIGQPRKDARGRINNAVMLLHGTGGSGAQFLQARFAGELFGPGQPLDADRWFIILPDNIG